VKLGVVSSGIRAASFEQGLTVLTTLGVGAVEIGCAGYHVDRTFGDPTELLDSDRALTRWLDAFRARDLEISALALHGQPLDPNRDRARTYEREFEAACRLAERIGVSRLTLLAGLPEAAEGDRTPNWIVVPFPPGSADAARWQWEERLLPYWTRQAHLARENGCSLCFEMHPGDLIFNPEALLRLREAIGPTVGCNFDPSHLFWQGIDPIDAMRALKDVIYHVHAKDLEIRPERVRGNGLMDPREFQRIESRAWSFRTVGFGHDALFWRTFVSELRAIGYDDVISIEHEDLYFDSEPALDAAVQFLRPIVRLTEGDPSDE
jgi:sugar phosphate isomerase/epimerase